MKKGEDGFYCRYIKRILDVTISVIALLVLSPVFVILTLVGAIAMKGNPFYVQDRPGKIDPKTGEEKIFRLIKFRTMTNEADENGNLLPSEQRLTRYGRFLRRTSLDELAQLINVLCSDMSLVGPRPLLVKYLPLYSEEQHRRHSVLPGLTGYAQVMGRNSIPWEEKFRLDVEYANNVSFKLDMMIVIKTIEKVLMQRDVEGSNSVIVEEFKGNKLEEKAF